MAKWAWPSGRQRNLHAANPSSSFWEPGKRHQKLLPACRRDCPAMPWRQSGCGSVVVASCPAGEFQAKNPLGEARCLPLLFLICRKSFFFFREKEISLNSKEKQLIIFA